MARSSPSLSPQLNNAILSRCRLVVFRKLPPPAISAVVRRALESDPQLAALRTRGMGDDGMAALVAAADGDARVALNLLELVSVGDNAKGEADANGGPHRTDADGAAPHADLTGSDVAGTSDRPPASSKSPKPSAVAASAASAPVDAAAVGAAAQHRSLYDRNGELHYDLISALHKSLRGGSADGALYYAARMLHGGEDPRYVTRRLIRFASEDVVCHKEWSGVQ